MADQEDMPWYDKVSSFMGLADDKTVNPNTGLTPQQQNLIGYNQLGSLGALLMAAGQRQSPAERAKYLAQIGQIPGQYAQQMTDAQKLLMQKQQFQGQQQLQKQQLEQSALKLQQGKAAAESLNTPEFKAQFDALPAPQKAVIDAARASGDYATINNILKEMQPKPDANGNVFDPKNNSIFNIYTGVSRTLPGAASQAGAASAAPSAPTAGATGVENPTGDEFMKTLPEGGFKNVVQSILNGTAVMPTNTRSPYWIQVQQAVQQADPAFSVMDAAARNRFVSDSAKGKLADQRNILGTFSEHLVGALDKAEKLPNGPLPAWNAATNEFLNATGDPRIKAFNTEVHAVMGEAGKMFRGGLVTNQEMTELGRNISAASSPAQLRGVLDSYKELVQGRVNSMDSSGEQIMGKAWNPEKYSVLNKAARDKLTAYENNSWGRPPKQQERPMGPDVPMSAIQALNQNPGLRDQFNKKYGQGKDIASTFLGQ
ncbi:hypothetical protein UFOVP155_15 [uncultured Caudovirales phage]|uniref:Uncharacterized protein n=1 Tax=uncultured Caudovirales phage TaxID=2100421 RepID=A0A6J7WCL2_9CAUD|nr:hypothetical protein UFOVP155_15 [uncultured Caudovirales phage]